MGGAWLYEGRTAELSVIIGCAHHNPDDFPVTGPLSSW